MHDVNCERALGIGIAGIKSSDWNPKSERRFLMRMETSATCRSDLLSADDAVEQYGAREHLHTNCDVDTVRSGDGNLLS